MKIRLLLSYQGTNFYGWQRQKKARTVQGEVEKALSHLFQKPLSVTGSGRTDTGVHALGQTAHFEIASDSWKSLNIVTALNHLTPPDISFHGAWKAPKEFHARFSAQKKTYSFFISTTPSPPAVGRDFVYWHPQELSLKILQNLAQNLVGTKDFKSFQTSGSSTDQTVKTIYSANWMKIAPFLYRFDITGDGFLRQMVRNLVGTQLALLKEETPDKLIRDILESHNRKMAFAPAPGQGLYLKEVFYPPELDKQCSRL